MKQLSKTFGIIIVLSLLVACNKKSVRPGKLKGHVWNVENYYSITNTDGTNYATWVNTGDGVRSDFENVSGTWEFTKDDSVIVDMQYSFMNLLTNQLATIEMKERWRLIMTDKQPFFDVQNDYDYFQYLIHEQTRRTVTIYWEDLWNGSERGDIYFIKLKK